MQFFGNDMVREKQSARRITSFGRMWDRGTVLYAYYPLGLDKEGKRRMIVGQAWGHRVNDSDALGLKTQFFIPSTMNISGAPKPKGEDILTRFSNLAPLFIEGQKNADILELEESCRDDKRTFAEGLKAIEEKYDVQKNKKAPKPVISKMMSLITTECFAFTLKGNEIDPENFNIVAQDLSNERIVQFEQEANAASAGVVQFGDREFLEIRYSFGSTGDKMKDGKVTPENLCGEDSLLFKFPNLIPTIEQHCLSIPATSDTMMARNSSYNIMTEKEIKKCISKYSIKNRKDLATLPEDSVDILCKNARIMKELAIPTIREDWNEKIEEYYLKDLENYQTEKREEETERVIHKSETLTRAPKLEDIAGEEELPLDISLDNLSSVSSIINVEKTIGKNDGESLKEYSEFLEPAQYLDSEME